IAVTALNALGLDMAKLQGAVIEGTQGLPGLDLAQNQVAVFNVNEADQPLVGAFYDASTTDNLKKYKVTVQFGDGSGKSTKGILLLRDPSNPHFVDIHATHTYDTVGTYDGTITVVNPAGAKSTLTFTAIVLNVLTAKGDTITVNANEAFNLKKVATFTEADTSETKSDFTARIDWGDGFQSNAVIEDTSTPGKFKVLGSHTYVGHQDATYTITVTIKDTLGSE